MNFASDNTAGAHPKIMEAIVRANTGRLLPYGRDDETTRVRRLVDDTFETETEVFFVATGTAANSLSLSVTVPPWGAIACHATAHIHDHESTGPSLFAGGAKTVGIDGPAGKFTAEALREVALIGRGDEHYAQVRAASVTQLTERGTAYRAEEVAAIGDVCRDLGLSLHMDGARFANAVASLNCTPAEMTWKAGVDVLSFGGTKNGCLAMEAVVFFNKDLGREFLFQQKRSGHVLSKMRMMAAQMEAYLADDLWLKNARHSNAMAKRLADGLSRLPGVEITEAVEGNQVFPRLPKKMVAALKAKGFQFYERGEGADGKVAIRLVPAFDIPAADVDLFIETAKGAA